MSSTPTMKVAVAEPRRVEEAERERLTLRLRALVEDGLTSGPATADAPSDSDELMAIARGDIA